jgi:hypothetical protein
MPRANPIRSKFRQIKNSYYFQSLSEEEKKFIRSLEVHIRRHGYDLIKAQQKAKLNKIYRNCRSKFEPHFVQGGLCSPR